MNADEGGNSSESWDEKSRAMLRAIAHDMADTLKGKIPAARVQAGLSPLPVSQH